MPTSHDELYNVIGGIVLLATGREWWRSTGMQSQPTGTYAVVYLGSDQPLEHQVVENIELDPAGDDGEVFEQKPWGAARLDCTVTFYRSEVDDSANDAATRFRNSLYIEQRYQDLWQISGLVGSVRTLDISGAFRADIEPRTEVRFSLMANIFAPSPLEGNQIFDIQSVEIDVTHVKPDGDETTIPLIIDSTSE